MLLDEYDYETDIEVQRGRGKRRRKKAGEEIEKKTRDSSKTCALIQKKLSEKEKQF